MTKIGPPALRLRAVLSLSCLRFCCGVFMAWLALSAAEAQTTNYALGTATLLLGPEAGTNSVVLAVTPQGASWTNTANASWLSLSPANTNGTGSTNVVFAFATNSGATRSGTLSIAGLTLTVTQAGTNYVAADLVAGLATPGLNEPFGLAVDSAGNVYIADTENSRISEWIETNNSVTNLVSSGLANPSGVAVDAAGNVYIADTGNSAIKEWSVATNKVTTLVSSGLSYPYGVAVDSAGNVYIADTYDNAIKEWSVTSHAVTTLVFSNATTPVNYPRGVAVDLAGNVYIADTFSNAIKKLLPRETIPTILVSNLDNPSGVAVDGAGNVYIADTYNNAIKKWSAASTNVTILITNGLNYPFGVAVDGAGNVYAADTLNNAIKELPNVFVDTMAISETNTAGSNQLSQVVPATANLSGPFAPTSSDTTWLTISDVTNGVVSFSFTTNTSGSNRVADINLLGLSIPVSQAAQLPAISTLAATIITSSNATLNASVSPEGALTTVYFAYGTNTTYSYTNVVTKTYSQTNAVVVTNNVTGLSLATTYHFQAFASNSLGTNAGGDLAFTTLAGTPLITNQFATNYTSSNAILSALVNPEGAATTVYFAYGTNTNYGGITTATNIGTNAISVTNLVTRLLANTKYYFQTIAINAEGTNTGSNVTFTTLVGTPLIASQSATDITSNTATLNASVNPEGATTRVYFVYGTTTNYGNTSVLTNSFTGTSAISVTNNVTALLPGTNYHFEVIATNSAGTNLGGDMIFTTPAGTPLIANQFATNISFGNATLAATVNPEGAATSVYFVYGTNATYGSTIVATNGANGISGLSVSNIITGLLPGVVYHFEAIASNSQGTYLGGDSIFTNTSAAISFLGTTSLVEGPAAGTGSVVLVVTPQTNWTVEANAAWLTPVGPGGTNSTNVVFTFAANTNSTRVGTLIIAGQTLTVTQAGSNYVAADSLTTLADSGLADPLGVAVDTNGNVYFADTGNNEIKKWSPANNAANILVSSGLDQPWGVAVDGAGNVFIANTGSNAIVKWTAATDTITNVVTNLSNPRGVAVDGAGNVYIANTGGNTIMEWAAANSNVTTLVSNGLAFPSGVAVDLAGNVYIANTGRSQVLEWSPGESNATTLLSGLDNPSGVAVDGSGNVYIANTGSDEIQKRPAGNTNLMTLESSNLSFPSGVAVDLAGNVYIANTGSNDIAELPYAFVDPAPRYENNTAGADALPTVLPATENLLAPFTPTSNSYWLTISTPVTNGVVSFSFTINTTGTVRTNYITLLGQPILVTQGGATFTLATTHLLEGPAPGNDSVVLVADPNFGTWTATTDTNSTWLHLSPANQSGTGGTNVVFSFDVNPGQARTSTLAIAGQTLTVAQAGSTYVPAQPLSGTLVANLNQPYGVAVDTSGNVYIADSGQGAIMEWTAANDTTTNLVSSGLSNPRGVAVDTNGNVYISDYANNAIYKWATNNTITNLVSSGLFDPLGLAVDGVGNVYIADYGNFAIKEYLAASNTVTNLVSSGLFYPSGVAVDAAGNVYIADTGNNAIKKWTAANNTVTVLASGLAGPSGVAVDGSGNVYIADTGNNAIKKWSATNNTMTNLVSSGLIGPGGVAVDGAGNVYIADTGGNAITELPYAFVDTTTKYEANGANSDQLPVVMPATANLGGPFTPTSSDTSWLNITNVASGQVSFSFAANTGTNSNRTAFITLLGQTISITQGTIALTSAGALTLTNLHALANGVFQFSFTNNPNATFRVLSATNLSLPLSDWTVVVNPLTNSNGVFQFTSQPTTNDTQVFYVVRSP